jgi:hypothetical protein
MALKINADSYSKLLWKYWSSSNVANAVMNQYGTTSKEYQAINDYIWNLNPVNSTVNKSNTNVVTPVTPVLKTTTSQPIQNNTTNTIPAPTNTKIEQITTQPVQTTTTEVKNTPTWTITTSTKPNVETNRTNEIITNLNEWYKNDLNVKNALDTWNWNAFKASYNMQNPEEAKIVEAYFQARQPKDAWWIYNILKTWQQIYNPTIQNSPEMSKAKARYDLSNKYQSMWVDQLYNAYVNWEIGSQLEQDIATNPNLAVAKAKYEKKVTTDQINNDAKNILSIYNKDSKKIDTNEEEKTPYQSFIEKIANNLSESTKSDIPSFNDYMKTNYPEIVTKSEELSAKNKLIKEKADERDNRLDAIIKENPWISINRATMLAARQNKDLNNEIKALSYEIGNLQADVNFQTTMADKSYGYDLQAQSRQDKLDAEQRGYVMDYLKTEDLRNYQEEQLADTRAYNEEQAALQFERQNPDINSSDPTIANIAAKQSIQDQLKFAQDNWIYIRRSEWQILSDANKYAKENWVSLWEALDKTFTSIVTWWDAYKNAIANIAAKQSPTTQLTQDWAKLSDWSLYNQKTWEVKQVWTIWSSVQQTWIDVWINYTNAYWTTKKLIIDSVAKDSLITALNSMWNSVIVWDTKRTGEQQTKLYDDYIVWKWWLAAKPWTSLHEKGLAIDIYWWTDKNWKLTAPTASQIKIMNDNWWFQTAWLWDKWHFEYTWQKSNQPLTDKQFTQYNQTISKFVANPLVKSFESALSSWWDLIASLKSKNWPWDVWAVFQFMKTLDPTSVVREWEFAVAQNSAWVPEKIWNLYEKVMSWKILTDEQRKAFWKVAFEYVKNKWKAYDIKYNEVVRILKNQWIPEDYYPTKMSEFINQFEWNTTQWPVSPKSDPLWLFN